MDDAKLDAALALLHGSVPETPPQDDERFAKRIAASVSNFAPVSKRDLEPLLVAPFPDDHHDLADEDFAEEHGRGDDHHAAHAADLGDVRGWEGSMSEDDLHGAPPSSLSALSGLTRSGPASRLSNDPVDGAAKGDDSGLIDLRAMSQPESAPEEPVAAAAAPAVVEERPAQSARAFNKTVPAVPTALGRNPTPPPAEKEPAKVAAATATVAAAAATPAPAAEKKKGGLVFLFGGLAAAAVAIAVAVPLATRKSENTTASAPAAEQEEKAKAKSDKKDEAPAPAASAAPVATADPAPSASAAEPDPAATVAIAPTAGAPVGAGGSMKGMAPAPGAGKPESTAKAGPDPKNVTPPPAPSTDPIKKPQGGSLDDVLGLGKNEATEKKADPTANLPDKPDSMDVRSAINGKVGAARACVKGQDEASSVSVTFGPGGSVSGVAVTSGPAKGTGAETCIKNAFSSAKVPPSKKGASGTAVLQP